MTIEQQIAAITAALTAVEHAIAQTESALNLAMTLPDIARLNQELVTLKARRTQLQFELINLQASLTGVMPLGMAVARAPSKLTATQGKQARSIGKALMKSSEDRRMVEASLAHSAEVLHQVASLQELLAGRAPL